MEKWKNVTKCYVGILVYQWVTSVGFFWQTCIWEFVGVLFRLGIELFCSLTREISNGYLKLSILVWCWLLLYYISYFHYAFISNIFCRDKASNRTDNKVLVCHYLLLFLWDNAKSEMKYGLYVRARCFIYLQIAIDENCLN